MAKKIQRKTQKPAGGGASQRSSSSSGGARKSRSVKDQLINDFTVQLAVLSEAGIPIVRALTILEGQTAVGPFKEVLGDVVEDVSAGTPMSEAMAKHDRVFDKLYSSMVRAGEAGGMLDQVLQRLAIYRERIAEIRAKIRGALIYPSVIMFVAVVVVGAVMVLVIPKFQEIFDSFGVEMPAMTQVLLNVSDFMVSYWYIVFGVPVVLFILHGFLMRKGGGYRYTIHKLLLKLPLIGTVLRQGLIAAFTRTFGTLLQAGVPHLEALAIVRDTSTNDVIIDSVEDIRRTVREGEGIAQPMEETGVFDDLVCNMVEVGEQTGELDTMLMKVADAYEKQVDRKIDALFKVLEPLLLILISVFVGFIVVALFMPLLEIMNTINTA